MAQHRQDPWKRYYERTILSETEFFNGVPCRVWTGYKNSYGYAMMSIANNGELVHRWAFTQKVGPIPPGHDLDHQCHDPETCTVPVEECPHRPCVEWLHMKPLLPRDNLLRGGTYAAANAAKTECPAGHPYDSENTYVVPSTGERTCRICIANNKQRAQEKRKKNGKQAAYYARTRGPQWNDPNHRSEIPHGRTRYTYGCRCDACREARRQVR